MRDIIRKERLIELVFEGQRFWDIRRWKIARDYWTLPRMSWGREKTDVGFYTPMIYNASIRNVSFKDYLYPISYSDLRANPNLVQTFGW